MKERGVESLFRGAGNIGFWHLKVSLGNPDPRQRHQIRHGRPLFLDLDGDGSGKSPPSRGVQFDGNGDTIRTNTSWVQADDGSLALDR